MRLRIPTLAIAIVVAGGVFADAQSQRPVRPAIPPEVVSSILGTLREYATDDFAVERWLRTPEGLRSVSFVPAVIGSKAPEWSRNTAAFLLEVAVTRSSPNRTINGVVVVRPEFNVINAGRTLLIGRPAPFGQDAAEDRFEVLWHQIALALLQGGRQYASQQDYLDVIGLRLEEAAKRGIDVTGRFALARAIAAAGMCCPSDPIVVNRVLVRFGRPITASADALALFERAAGIPATHVEALIRGGVVEHILNRESDAVDWFERAPARHPDRLLGYLQHLTRGRALDALDRPVDAAASYRIAREYGPQGQLAGLGLAAALLRAGEAEEAVMIATDVRRKPDDGIDYLAEFDRADARFVPQWLGELRGLKK